MSTRTFGELSSSERRRAVAAAAARFLLTFAIVLAVYFLVPLEGGQLAGSVIIRLTIALLVLVAMVAWQVRQIVRARFPTLRATEALGFALPFFLCTFAASYVALAASEATAFSEPLSHTDGLYFTVVVFGTVGFGDIAPVSDFARLLVSAQVLLDLVFIALVVRVLFAASRRKIADTEGSPTPG